MNLTKRLILLLGFWAVLTVRLPAAQPLSTAFTYQGRLLAGGAPVNGLFDFQVVLLDDATLGSIIGPVLTNRNVTVSNGVFNTTLDFGSGVFTGTMYWLEVALRPSGSPGAFSLLSPRQPITAAPYALHALTSGSERGTNGAAAWQLSGNAGIDPATDFLGTTDNQALELRVNRQRALRLEPTSGDPNVIAGAPDNVSTAGSVGVTIAGGGNQSVAADHGTIVGGHDNIVAATASKATILGGAGAQASAYGQVAHANGSFGTTGDAQTSIYLLRQSTTGSTTTELFLDGAGQRIQVPVGARWAFEVTAVAADTSGNAASWKMDGLIKNVGGTTSLVGFSAPLMPPPIASDVGENWILFIEADDTLDALVLRGRGLVSSSIRWVARVRTVELIR